MKKSSMHRIVSPLESFTNTYKGTSSWQTDPHFITSPDQLSNQLTKLNESRFVIDAGTGELIFGSAELDANHCTLATTVISGGFFCSMRSEETAKIKSQINAQKDYKSR